LKLIGLIGGTTWYSTIEYYRLLNEIVNRQLGKSHSAKLLLYSVDFEEFRPSTNMSEWDEKANNFLQLALRLEDAGAKCLLLCANTTHLIADVIQNNISIPLIHIAKVTAASILEKKIHTVGLLGTKVTMEQSFFKDILASNNINTLIPTAEDREFIHESILSELGKGILNEDTKNKYLKIINLLIDQGAQGIVLACTEIPLLIAEEEVAVPSFNTTKIHAEAAVAFALKS
jgi:aspartate racemase